MGNALARGLSVYQLGSSSGSPADGNWQCVQEEGQAFQMEWVKQGLLRQVPQGTKYFCVLLSPALSIHFNGQSGCSASLQECVLVR